MGKRWPTAHNVKLTLSNKVTSTQISPLNLSVWHPCECLEALEILLGLMLVVLYTFTPIKLDPIPLTKEKRVLHYFDVTIITYFISSEYKDGDITSQPGLP